MSAAIKFLETFELRGAPIARELLSAVDVTNKLAAASELPDVEITERAQDFADRALHSRRC